MSSRRANPLFPSLAWRFLLPSPAPGHTVSFGRGEAASMARELPGPGCGADDRLLPVDLVVGDDPAAAELRQMYHRVRPGGTLYAEYRRPGGRRNADRLRRCVTDAGFDDVRAFSVSARRTFHQPTWWIPLREPAATTYLLASRQAELTRYPRWRQILERGYLALLARLGTSLTRSPWWLFPGLRHRLCLVARKPLGPGATVAHWTPEAVAASVGGPEASHGPTPPFLLRVGGTATDRAILIVLDRHRSDPRSVAKLPTLDAEQAEADCEAAMLTSLAGVPGVPRVVHHWRGSGYAGLAQSFVPGERMDGLATRAELNELAPAVTAWLAELATTTAGPAGCRWLNDLAARSLEELAGTLATDTKLDSLLARTRRLLIFERPLPPVAQHRDLGPWNLLVDQAESIGVIDWVDGTTEGVPMVDLVHFLTHLVLSTSGGYHPQRRHQVLAAMHDPATAAGALVAGCQQSYITRLGIAVDDVPRLRVLAWVLDLLRQDPPQRVTSLYLTLWRDELERTA